MAMRKKPALPPASKPTEAQLKGMIPKSIEEKDAEIVALRNRQEEELMRQAPSPSTAPSLTAPTTTEIDKLLDDDEIPELPDLDPEEELTPPQEPPMSSEETTQEDIDDIRKQLDEKEKILHERRKKREEASTKPEIEQPQIEQPQTITLPEVVTVIIDKVDNIQEEIFILRRQLKLLLKGVTPQGGDKE